MRNHPEGETRKDRFNQWIVGIGIVLVLACVVTSTLLLIQHNSDLKAINSAVQTVKSNQEANKPVLSQTEKNTTATKVLQQQVNGIIKKLPHQISNVNAFAAQILAVEQFAVKCLTTGNCANPPPVSTTATG